MIHAFHAARSASLPPIVSDHETCLAPPSPRSQVTGHTASVLAGASVCGAATSGMLHEFQGYGGAAARSARPSARYQAPPTFAGHSSGTPPTGFEGRSRSGRQPSRASSTGRSSSPRSSRSGGSDYGGSDYGGRSSPRSASSSPRSWRPTSRGARWAARWRGGTATGPLPARAQCRRRAQARCRARARCCARPPAVFSASPPTR